MYRFATSVRQLSLSERTNFAGKDKDTNTWPAMLTLTQKFSKTLYISFWLTLRILKHQRTGWKKPTVKPQVLCWFFHENFQFFESSQKPGTGFFQVWNLKRKVLSFWKSGTGGSLVLKSRTRDSLILKLQKKTGAGSCYHNQRTTQHTSKLYYVCYLSDFTWLQAVAGHQAMLLHSTATR